MIQVFMILVLLFVPLSACSKSKPKAVPQKPAQQAQPAETAKKEEALPQKAEEKKVQVEAYAYDPKGRRDPFLSIIEASKKEKEVEKKKRSLRPSEAYDVPDVKVIAIAKDKERYYAMILLPDKKYFTIREGTPLGLYGGKVISIDAKSVVVREYIKDYKGEIQPKDTILRLRKEEGQ
jgi:type IV pilus assembly protein PilP